MFVLLSSLEEESTKIASVNSLESALTCFGAIKSSRINTYVKNRGGGVVTVNFLGLLGPFFP